MKENIESYATYRMHKKNSPQPAAKGESQASVTAH